MMEDGTLKLKNLHHFSSIITIDDAEFRCDAEKITYDYWLRRWYASRRYLCNAPGRCKNGNLYFSRKIWINNKLCPQYGWDANGTHSGFSSKRLIKKALHKYNRKKNAQNFGTKN